MNSTSNNPKSPFSVLKFLRDQHSFQIRQADSADEIMEDRLGQLLYVDDYAALSPEAKKYINDEQAKLNDTLLSISLVNNVISQSVIIAVDRVIKSVSQDIADAKKGPMIPKLTGILGDVSAPQVYWAHAVRCAANYVRHAGEWKSEAVDFLTKNAKFPNLSDFQRADTRSNLDTLSSVLECDIKNLIHSDCTHSLAKRLDLLKERELDAIFQAWRNAQ